MPISRSNLGLTTKCMHYCCAERHAINARLEQSNDDSGYPISFYLCIGDTRPGRRVISEEDDLEIDCELDINDVGVLMVYRSDHRVQGLCELKISSQTPGWVFKSNEKTVMRIPVFPQTLRPMRTTKANQSQGSNEQSHVATPQIIKLKFRGSNIDDADPPEIYGTLLMERVSLVSPDRSIHKLPDSQQLPDVFSHGRRVEVAVQSVKTS